MLRQLGLVSLLVMTSACSSVSYYYQAAKGQWQLVSKRQPIEQLLADQTLDEKLKQRLLLSQTLRSFASEQLALPDNNSYRYYADLGRSHVVWNVFATEPYSVEAKRWCFPIAGCVAYKGYFSEQAARHYAGQLEQQGFETYVGGVAAYSTLGWFDDPLLNTFIYRSDVWLAALIFHELAHQQYYLPGDTTFNESYAQTVELAGVERWLASAGDASAEKLAAYKKQQQMQDEFVAMVLATRQALAELYQQPMPDREKQQAKQQLFDELASQHYPRFKQRWQGYSGYDRWINQGLNNAKLNTLASYHQWVPAFQCLLQQHNNQLDVFYQQVAALGQLNNEQRRERLLSLAESC